MKTNYPTLFKKTATGAIQSWNISVTGSNIRTEFGQVGGKRQDTVDVIKSGKSAGKKNETTSTEQAIKEAKARWEKKKKSGYVESMEDARDGKVDEIIEGGIVPMTAKVLEDYEDKIKYPVLVQPKLDGERMTAIFDSKGKVSLWTRTRKRITSVPHIEKYLNSLGLKKTELDGELYRHDLNKDFEKLMSAARKQNPSPESALLEYHVYDVVSEDGVEKRINKLYGLLEMAIPPIHFVQTHTANNRGEVQAFFERFLMQGYEGAMIRTYGTKYEHKRSSQLLKMKEFKDDEFEIVGLEEGRGKLAGHCGAFVCKTKSGEKFNAKMSGQLERLKDFWENKEKYIGKMLTVKYQDLTGYGIPRFPVGVRIREDR